MHPFTPRPGITAPQLAEIWEAAGLSINDEVRDRLTPGARQHFGGPHVEPREWNPWPAIVVGCTVFWLLAAYLLGAFG